MGKTEQYIQDKAVELKNEYMRKWRAKNKDKVNSYHKIWVKNNPEKVKEYNENYWIRKAEQSEV